MPPCAQTVLLSSAIAPFVTIVTCAPRRAAASAAAQPARPLPMTRMSVMFLDTAHCSSGPDAGSPTDSKSRARSIDGAECVSAPTEIVSTPASA